MRNKILEIRDDATFIPVLAVQLAPTCEQDRYLLARAGYGRSSTEQSKYIMICQLAGGSGKCTTDPYEHGRSRTMEVAHKYIQENWEKITSGEVIDVQFILGETKHRKQSESRQDWL